MLPPSGTFYAMSWFVQNMAAKTVRRLRNPRASEHSPTQRGPKEIVSLFTENTRDLHEFIAAGMQNTFCSTSGRKPQLSSHFVKGATMPALDTTDIDQPDMDQTGWTELQSTTCSVPHTFEFRFNAAPKCDKNDFLTWSRRQKDAENIMEYDE